MRMAKNGATQILGLRVQRLWHAFTARSAFRCMHEMHFLLYPTDMRNFNFWAKCQNESHPPKSQVGQVRSITRGVVFYANTITKRALWSKPKESKVKEFSTALRVQRLRDFSNMLSLKDLQKDPLYVHSFLQDSDQARENHEGVDNAFVLYSCAIFGAVTNEEDWEDIKDCVRRAKAADEHMNRRRGDKTCSYRIAT